MSPEKTKERALNAFAHEFEKAIRILSLKSQVSWHPAFHLGKDVYAIFVHFGTKGESPLMPVACGTEKLFFQAIHHVRPVEEEDGYRVSTALYIYTIWETETRALLSWHYHPETTAEPIEFPHLHYYADTANEEKSRLHKLHIPTGRVSVEDVLRFLIVEFQAKPATESWDAVLRSTTKMFEQNKTWGKAAPKK